MTDLIPDTRIHALEVELQQARDDRDGAEQLTRALLAERVTAYCWEAGVPVPDEADMYAICECLIEDWRHGTAVDDLDIERHVNDWRSGQ